MSDKAYSLVQQALDRKRALEHAAETTYQVWTVGKIKLAFDKELHARLLELDRFEKLIKMEREFIGYRMNQLENRV